MQKLLTSGWMIPIVGSLLYIGTTVLLLDPDKLEVPERHSATAEDDELAGLLSEPWDFNVPELDKLVEELKREKDAVARRARELDELESRIQVEIQELNSITQMVAQAQQEFNDLVAYVKASEEDNLKRLANTYAAMPPADAVAILKQMDDGQIVRILMFLKEEEIAKILSAMVKGGPEDAKRAALLSQKLRMSVSGDPSAARKQTKSRKTQANEASATEELARINYAETSRTDEDFRKMARTYAVLPPAQAANLLVQLQDDQVAEILAHFTEEEAAKVIAELSSPAQGGSQRAANITALLQGESNRNNS